MTTLTIQKPAADCAHFASLPRSIRDEIRAWRVLIDKNPPTKPVVDYIKNLAAQLGIPYSTTKTKYYALKKSQGDWRVLINNSKLPKDDKSCRTNNLEFRNFVTSLVESYHRKSAPAYRQLRADWRSRKTIPGYEDLPDWPKIPVGWSDKNLNKIYREHGDVRVTKAIRSGTTSKTNQLLSQVHTTRIGLWPGAVYQFDDMWHDNFVTVGEANHTTRVIELGVLDLFSGSRFHWGMKPRMPKDDGSGLQNIKEREMRFFLAAVLYNYGYSPRGTVLSVERGTAAIRADVEAILHDATMGPDGVPLVTVSHAPVDGAQGALAGYYPGTDGGNFRSKAALESVHNLIHNDLSHLAMQTGKDSKSRPVTTNHILSYQAGIIKACLKKCPEMRDQLRLPTLDFHAEFAPLISNYYRHGLNARTQHNLEGWSELGFLVTEYAMIPNSGKYLSRDEYLALPDASQNAIYHAAQADPKSWINRRKLSPNEVYNPAIKDLIRIPAHVVCDILSQDLAREETVKGSYFRFYDLDIGPGEMIYESRIKTIDGYYTELQSGQKYQVFANPFDPRWLFVCDAAGGYLGQSELYQKTSSNDMEGIKNQSMHKRSRNAQILEPLRVRHDDAVRDAAGLKEHNRRVIAGEPTNPAERRRIGAAKAQITRHTNKVQNHAASINSDEALDAWSSQPTAHTIDNADPADDYPDDSDSYDPFSSQ